MPSSPPILTLGIPTYNRAATIGSTLNSLMASLTGVHPNEVEILIHDNASSDDTAKILADFRMCHPEWNIRIIRNPENVGYDGNHLLVFQNALGRYLHFCSDRYYYELPYRQILDVLANEAPAALTFSDLYRSKQPLGKKGSPGFGVMDEWLSEKIPGITITRQGRHFLMTRIGDFLATGWGNDNLPFLNVSDTIIRRQDCSQRSVELERFRESYMLVCAAMMQAYRDSNDTVAILHIPWFSHAFQRINHGGNRHDFLRLAYGNLLISETFEYHVPRMINARRHLLFLCKVAVRSCLRPKEREENPIRPEDLKNYLVVSGYVPTASEQILLSVISNPALRLVAGCCYPLFELTKTWRRRLGWYFDGNKIH